MTTKPIQETGTCSLCGQPYEHYGNNPQPVLDRYEQRCCDKCNWELVVPARIYPVVLSFSEAKLIHEALSRTPKVQAIIHQAMIKLIGKRGSWEEAKAQQDAALAALKKIN